MSIIQQNEFFKKSVTNNQKSTDIIDELMKMIKAFNCQELSSLMLFAQKSKQGKKADLVERATKLVKEGCDMPIQIKINEIYNSHCARLKIQRTDSASKKIEKPKRSAASVSKKFVIDDLSTDSSNSSSNSSWGPENYDSSDSVSTISNKSVPPVVPPDQSINLKIKIKKSVIDNQPTSSNLLPLSVEESVAPEAMDWNPIGMEVKMLKLPFYNHLYQILKPVVLTRSYASSSSMHSFYLSPSHITALEKSKIWHADGMMEYKTQALLRFGVFDPISEQDDCFPPRLYVTVNNKQPALPALIPITKIGTEPKRPNRPVNITQLLRLNTYERNIICVKWDDTALHDFVISVEVDQQLTSSELLQRLKQTGSRPAHLTKALIKEKMKASNDNEISATSLRISLSCPLSKMRLSVPVRSSSCSHLQCFDASTFIQMNEKKPSWMCPVCDRPARYETLFIDGLFIEILSKVSDTTDVIFTEDGEWSPIFPRKIEKKQSKSEKCVTLISDSPEHNSSSITTVDLTNSDDDDIETTATAHSVLDDIQALMKTSRDKSWNSFFDQL